MFLPVDMNCCSTIRAWRVCYAIHTCDYIMAYFSDNQAGGESKSQNGGI